MDEIKIVEEFNLKNRYRDNGKINNAIDRVISYAKKHLDDINTINCQGSEIKQLLDEIERLRGLNTKKDEVIIRLASKV